MIKNLTPRQQQIMHLAEMFVLSSKMLAWVLHYHRYTMSRDLKTLEALGLLKRMNSRGQYRLCVK